MSKSERTYVLSLNALRQKVIRTKEAFLEVVVAHLVEQLLLIPEVRGSTPVIGKIYIEHLFVYLFIINCIEKTKINKKRPGMVHFL